MCVLMQSIFFITYLCRLDWVKTAEEVSVHILLIVKMWSSIGLGKTLTAAYNVFN